LVKDFSMDSYTNSLNQEVYQLLKIYKTPTDHGRIVCKQSEVFDVLKSAHCTTGHLKVENTYSRCRYKYYNVTRAVVKFFIDLCPICSDRKPKIKKLKGAAKPIMSTKFRDRFQVDLIDMSHDPQTNPTSQVMKWILVCKDHLTGFHMVRALPAKKASIVAHELSLLWGMMGYPLILHTDNGTEFVAKDVMEFVKE
jgi:Integrase zinc binding domain